MDQLGGAGSGGGNHRPQAPAGAAQQQHQERRLAGLDAAAAAQQQHNNNSSSNNNNSQGQAQAQAAAAPPQLRCPRCQSNNTKFCYYNNYSLSQPRYFCKGCRRYWTHGGTLRNVPVGGCSRKSKRPKLVEPTTTAAQHHQHQVLLPPDHHHHHDVKPKVPNAAAAAHLAPIVMGANLGLVSSHHIGSSASATLASQMIGTHYQGYGGGGGGGGFLSSLAAIQAMNSQRPTSFSQALGVGGGGGGGVDMDSPLLRGFALPSFGIRQATPRPSTSWQQQQGLMGNVINQQSGDPAGSDARFWSIGSSSGGGGENNNSSNNNGNHAGSGASQHPNLQWPDFSGGCGLGDHHDG